MKITKLEVLPLLFPYEKPIYDSNYRAKHRQSLLVKVYTDNGMFGIGEAASFGGPMESTAVVLEKEIAPLITGEDPLNVERIWRKVYHNSWQHGRGGILMCALSGVDIALWDLIGKYLKTPLYQILGGYTDKVPAYASAGFYKEGKGQKEIVEEVLTAVEKGYKAVKIKVGRTPTPLNPLELMPDPDYKLSLEDDLARVEAVSKAIGSGVKLLVDANCAWDLHTAMNMSREFEKLGVFAFEEPICTDNLDGSAKLNASTDIKVAGYETAQGLYQFRELIRNHCVDVVQPDVIWSGGITEARKIANLAHAFHKTCMPHCFSSAVAFMATLNFICSIPNGELLEFDQNPNPLRQELWKEPIEIDSNGFVHVPNRPGIGIELNEAAIDKYYVKLNY